MITHFIAAVLGIVEGLTEFLPISSTAHLTLTAQAFGLDQSAFTKSFEIVIQGGAILAVVVLFWKKFLDMEILKRVLAAFIPTAVVGFVLYKFIKQYLIGNLAVTLWALAIGGVILMFFERAFQKMGVQTTVTDIHTLGYGKSALIGLAQALAVIPGVSRSAATIVSGLWVGLSKEAVVEFSFLLAIPTVLAATGYDLLQNIHSFSSDGLGLMGIGFLVSFLTALIAIRFFLDYIKKHSFKAFGAYRIILVVCTIIVLYVV